MPQQAHRLIVQRKYIRKIYEFIRVYPKRIHPSLNENISKIIIIN